MLPNRDQDKGKQPMKDGHVNGFSVIKGLWPPSHKVNGGSETEGQGPWANRPDDPFLAITRKQQIMANAMFDLTKLSTSGPAGTSSTASERMASDSRPTPSNTRPTSSNSRLTPLNSRTMTSDLQPATSGSGPLVSNNWRMRSEGTSNNGTNGHGTPGPSHAQESRAGSVPQGLSRSSFPQNREQRPRLSPQAPEYQPQPSNADNTTARLARSNSWELMKSQYQQRQMSTQPERALVRYDQLGNGLTGHQPDRYELCLEQAFSDGRLEQADYNLLAYRLKEMAAYQSEMASKQQTIEGGREGIKCLTRELKNAQSTADQAKKAAARAERELDTARSDYAALLSRYDQMQTLLQAWQEASIAYRQQSLDGEAETY